MHGEIKWGRDVQWNIIQPQKKEQSIDTCYDRDKPYGHLCEVKEARHKWPDIIQFHVYAMSSTCKSMGTGSKRVFICPGLG